MCISDLLAQFFDVYVVALKPAVDRQSADVEMAAYRRYVALVVAGNLPQFFWRRYAVAARLFSFRGESFYRRGMCCGRAQAQVLGADLRFCSC